MTLHCKDCRKFVKSSHVDDFPVHAVKETVRRAVTQVATQTMGYSGKYPVTYRRRGKRATPQALANMEHNAMRKQAYYEMRKLLENGNGTPILRIEGKRVRRPQAEPQKQPLIQWFRVNNQGKRIRGSVRLPPIEKLEVIGTWLVLGVTTLGIGAMYWAYENYR